MTFESKEDVLNWYEGNPRTLTKEFIDGIPWNDVKNYPLDPKFVRVILYMRDVEVLTDMYHQELKRTPTGRDPVISKFMERWGVEEITHGEVLNRFLNEAGYPTEEKWMRKVREGVSRGYEINTQLITSLTNLIGRRFTATHMTFGAINEISAMQAYRRLMMLADHPVLDIILRAIIREESTHAQFYSSVAKLELRRSDLAQKLARFLVRKFWLPVGQGAKTASEAQYPIRVLFSGEEGLMWIEEKISKRVQEFPGFKNLATVKETLCAIASRQDVALESL